MSPQIDTNRKEVAVDLPVNEHLMKNILNKSMFSEDKDKSGKNVNSMERERPNIPFGIQIDKIIPEILRVQFFQTKLSDSSDCLLEVCEKFFRRYRDKKRTNLQEGHEVNAQSTKMKEDEEVN